MPPENPEKRRGRNGFTSRLLVATRSLQCKSILVVLAISLTVTAVVSGYLLHSGMGTVRGLYHEQVVQLSSMLAEAASEPMAARDTAVLARIARDVARGSPILYVAFTDTSGQSIAAAEHRQTRIRERAIRDRAAVSAATGTPVYHPRGDGHDAFLDIVYPVRQRERGGETHVEGETASTKLLGYVQIGMVVDTWQRAVSHTIDLVTGVGCIAVVIALPFGFLLVRRVLTPLEGVTQAMYRFSSGEMDVRSEIRRRDEIGRLAEAFNRMADQQQSTHERLVNLNADLEERVAQRTRQLRELAAREPLTGLYNRRHFNDVLRRSIAEARRHEAELSCLMIDLDEFKKVNDQCGHHAGDELLILVAKSISSHLRRSDVAARYGGDEFVVLLPRTDGQRARKLAQRIIDRLSEDIPEQYKHLDVGASIGIASLRDLNSDDPDMLIRTADLAMYAAKTEGKNRIHVAGETIDAPPQSPPSAFSRTPPSMAVGDSPGRGCVTTSDPRE